VQFSTHCIISLYVLFLSQHCRVQFNTHCIMLQYSSTHTVSCYSAVQHTLYHLSVCVVPSPTLHSTVQHTLYHVTVQFNTHSVMLQCSSAHTVSSLCMSCSFPNTAQYSSTHNLSCYSTVQHTQFHVILQFGTLFIISLYVLFLFQHCTVQFNTLYHVTVLFNTQSVKLQCSSAQTVSSLCMYCSFPNTVQYSSTHIASCYSTVQHTQCHVTVQFSTHCINSLYVLFFYQHYTVHFSTHCIISLYVLFLFQHCTVQFNTHCVMLQYSSAHTLSCYSTVHYTHFHVTEQFSTHCIISL